MREGRRARLFPPAFLGWFGAQAARAWRDGREAALARAGSIALGAAMLHSLVEYPLRTAAILALCALCAALMIAPAEEGEPPPA